MRTLLLVAWLAALALALPYALAAQAPRPAVRITPTATLEAVRTAPAGQVRFYLLWNRNVSARPIGHAYQSCQVAHEGFVCTGVYSFPYGRITTAGETHTFARFSSVVTGGSRSRRARREGQPGYVGAEGTCVTRRIGPGTYTVTFLLERRTA